MEAGLLIPSRYSAVAGVTIESSARHVYDFQTPIPTKVRAGSWARSFAQFIIAVRSNRRKGLIAGLYQTVFRVLNPGAASAGCAVFVMGTRPRSVRTRIAHAARPQDPEVVFAHNLFVIVRLLFFPLPSLPKKMARRAGPRSARSRPECCNHRTPVCGPIGSRSSSPRIARSLCMAWVAHL